MSIDIRVSPDKNHLTMLAVFHYVLAGFNAFGGCVPLIHVSIGVAMISGAFDGANPPPPELGWFFVCIGGSISLTMWTFALLKLIAGRCLQKHTGYGYCFFIAI